MESNDDYYTATDQTNQPASQPLSLSSVCPRTVVTRNLSNLFLRLLPQQGQRQQQQHYRCYCCRSCSRYVESMSSSSAKPISSVCMCVAGWLYVPFLPPVLKTGSVGSLRLNDPGGHNNARKAKTGHQHLPLLRSKYTEEDVLYMDRMGRVPCTRSRHIIDSSRIRIGSERR